MGLAVAIKTCILKVFGSNTGSLRMLTEQLGAHYFRLVPQVHMLQVHNHLPIFIRHDTTRAVGYIAVGIATRLLAGLRRMVVRFWAGTRGFFPLLLKVHTGSRSHSASC